MAQADAAHESVSTETSQKKVLIRQKRAKFQLITKRAFKNLGKTTLEVLFKWAIGVAFSFAIIFVPLTASLVTTSQQPNVFSLNLDQWGALLECGVVISVLTYVKERWVTRRTVSQIKSRDVLQEVVYGAVREVEDLRKAKIGRGAFVGKQLGRIERTVYVTLIQNGYAEESIGDLSANLMIRTNNNCSLLLTDFGYRPSDREYVELSLYKKDIPNDKDESKGARKAFWKGCRDYVADTHDKSLESVFSATKKYRSVLSIPIQVTALTGSAETVAVLNVDSTVAEQFGPRDSQDTVKDELRERIERNIDVFLDLLKLEGGIVFSTSQAGAGRGEDAADKKGH
jgi:hypothetical protein